MEGSYIVVVDDDHPNPMSSARAVLAKENANGTYTKVAEGQSGPLRAIAKDLNAAANRTANTIAVA